ncbi:MAG: 4-hydroxy-tetrahydrodipicolinate reductase, partial [Clostridia bacterium]|nr:4-hydroxy-tetrahydrodipicolinate reductase [Clostridia bacterium]
IVGEHEVIFAGNDEVISISHTAFSKEVFAMGALRAASFIADKPAGLYDMSDILAV